MSDYSTRNISSPDTTISDKATLAGKVTDLNRLTDEHLTLVIDANVFMGAGTDPFKLYHDSDIVIPYAVIHTLDEHRSDGGGIGWACRLVLDHIEQLRLRHQRGQLRLGSVKDYNNNTVRIVESRSHQSYHLGDGRTSTAVIDVAKGLVDSADKVVVVSNSLLTRLRANDSGIDAMAYSDNNLQPFDGWFDIEIDNLSDDISDDAQPEILQPVTQWSDQLTSYIMSWLHRHITKSGANTPANMAIRINHNRGCTPQIVLKHGDQFVDLNYKLHAGGIYPRRNNSDQLVALTYLLDPDIQVVSLGGVAGSGKSILALAAGIEQVNTGQYDRIMVFRSMVEVAQQEIGFLPGDLDAKMAPWAQAIWDNVDQIDRKNGKAKTPKHSVANARKRYDRSPSPRSTTESPTVDRTTGLQEAQQRHLDDISVQPVTYLRGRTFVNTFVIVDDAQSLDRTTLLDIISRLGHGSKIVFTYDMTQQDNPYISNSTSILSVVGNLMSEEVFAHIDFTKSERSPLAQLAADLLAKEA